MSGFCMVMTLMTPQKALAGERTLELIDILLDITGTSEYSEINEINEKRL